MLDGVGVKLVWFGVSDLSDLSFFSESIGLGKVDFFVLQIQVWDSCCEPKALEPVSHSFNGNYSCSEGVFQGYELWIPNSGLFGRCER